MKQHTIYRNKILTNNISILIITTITLKHFWEIITSILYLNISITAFTIPHSFSISITAVCFDFSQVRIFGLEVARVKNRNELLLADIYHRKTNVSPLIKVLQTSVLCQKIATAVCHLRSMYNNEITANFLKPIRKT